MKIKEYNQKIVLAFGCGSGGLYVQSNYDEAVRGNETLKDIVISLVEDIKSDLNDPRGLVEAEHAALLTRVGYDDDDVCYLRFINDYLDGRKESHPELCGAVAGILFREGNLKEALDFLEVSNMEEARYWDS